MQAAGCQAMALSSTDWDHRLACVQVLWQRDEHWGHLTVLGWAKWDPGRRRQRRRGPAGQTGIFSLQRWLLLSLCID